MRSYLAFSCALTLAACGSTDAQPQGEADQDQEQDEAILAPVIGSFTASSATLAPGGGMVVLAWEQSGADELTIDNGVGVVTGLASKEVDVAATTTFVLTATNPGGSTSAQATVEVAVLTSPPTINAFSATPASLAAGGGTTTLLWNVDGASTLSINDGAGSSVDVTGTTQRDFSLPLSKTFTLSASNMLGTTTATATVDVAIPESPPAVMSFTADRTLVPAGGGAVRLSWVQSGASQLTINNGVGNVWGRDFVDVQVEAQTTFALTATNVRGSSQSTVQINVQDAIPVISSFSSNPQQRNGPGYVTLQWAAANYATLTINQGVGDVTFTGGGKQVWVDATTTYTLTATNSENQAAQATHTVTVN